ncbi:GNAT family N-acetyltransferase [Deinococcus sp. HMF7620]|uniref:GNAT family N-acetyltransferase n=1 Tax=Deinococcus arboris TaxID=2682977 RepID=A0A7C9MA06_9DEIO|nr:GNAT family N-acetyltransferase [Deinococcus arboris]MVN88019.1 GNAT family N-acetyltransferase [Deinococcus arboris]
MPQPLVRPLTPQDRGAVLRIFLSNVPDFFLPTERADFETDLNETPQYLVVEVGGEVVACGGVALEDDMQTGFFVWGMVARERQGQGLGTVLVEARLRLLRDLGARRVCLDTSQLTAPFYERLGFEVRQRTPEGYGPGLDRLEMERAL